MRRALFEPEVERRRGRVVKRLGDGWIVEFPSVSDAVDCALVVQEALVGHDVIRLRMGIHIGEVVFEDEDVFGDGINVASRLEQIAEPGSVVISDTTYNSLDERSAARFSDGGGMDLKNIARRLRIWRWWPDGIPTAPIDQSVPASEKSSIAVLPFTNMSGDIEQKYFADGVAEEIITALSRFSWLFVISRNSSFLYKGKAVDVTEVGRNLRVRYVLEGSVRRAGGRMRISGQLIDAISGAHLWADRYDGNIEDIFDLQDQVTSSVVGAIAPKLERAEIERVKHQPTNSLDANDSYLRGMAAFYRWGVEHNQPALAHFYRACEIDPDYAIAHAMAARCYSQRAVFDPVAALADVESIAEAERLARRAADLGRDDAITLSHAGTVLGFIVRDVRGGLALTQRAVAFNPNLAVAWFAEGWLKVWLGEPEAAIQCLNTAIQLSPQDPTLFQLQSGMSNAYFGVADYDGGWAWAEKALHDKPNHFPALITGMANAVNSGRNVEVEILKARILELLPTINRSFLSSFLPYQEAEDVERWTQAIEKTGFPE